VYSIGAELDALLAKRSDRLRIHREWSSSGWFVVDATSNFPADDRLLSPVP
tara:strand:- start:93 stop:245 length:153 start_codon:yes stop_codon:yes gene_type:complete